MKRKRLWLALGGVLIAAVSVGAYTYWTDRARLTTEPVTSGLERGVSGDALVSSDGPAVRMAFDEQYEYVGGQRFVLYGMADVEQHFFVEERLGGGLESFFWVQFEGFLPDNDYTYDYSDSPLRVEVNGFDFYADTEPGETNRLFPHGSSGTDGYLARRFVTDRGFSLPDHYFYARLVHLPDDAHREELLIIFMDDIGSEGLTAEDLREGGEHRSRWPEVEAAHLAKIERAMELSRP